LAENVTTIRGARGIARAERGAPLAIVSGGLTMYEFCRAGIPCLVLCQTDFETGAAAEMQRRGAVSSLGRGDAAFRETVVNAVRELLDQQAKRVEISAKASSLIDGRGAERVVDLLLSL
jgi:spore coat polysaccharide biosynthesis predicted glycosyltransferase SpsG